MPKDKSRFFEFVTDPISIAGFKFYPFLEPTLKNEANLKWVGMKVKAEFVQKPECKPTDVYFVPC